MFKHVPYTTNINYDNVTVKVEVTFWKILINDSAIHI